MVFALVLALAPLLWRGGFALSLLSQMGIAVIACLSYNILLGQGGMLSFGHAVYSGMGSFLAMYTLNQAAQGAWPVPVALVPLAGGLAGWFFAALFGGLTTRHGGTPLAMITLGMGELVWAVALMLPGVFGGEGGISGNRAAGVAFWGIGFGPQIQVYGLIALYCFVCTAAMHALTRTPLGRLLNAVRDNPRRIEYIGYAGGRVRYLAFMIAGFFAGVSGALAALNFEWVSTEVLSPARSGAYLLFVVLGGSTVFFGPILGAVLMVLALSLLPLWTQAWLLYLGLAFMLTVAFAPGGLAGLLINAWRLARRGLLRGRWRPGGVALAAAVVMALAMTIGGGIALVEMLYRLRADAALGAQWRVFGWVVQTASATHWAAAAAVTLCGAAGWVLLWRHALPRWRAAHERAAPPPACNAEVS